MEMQAMSGQPLLSHKVSFKRIWPSFSGAKLEAQNPHFLSYFDGIGTVADDGGSVDVISSHAEV
jgi:hypothetical protein